MDEFSARAIELCVCVLSMGSRAALGQLSVLTEKPTGAQEAEIKAWGSMYLAKLQAGEVAEGASSFAFSTAVMNSPLFSPLRAAQLTASKAIGADECATVGVAQDTVVTAYLTTGSVTASLVDAPAMAVAVIQAALLDPTAVLDVRDDDVIASNLTPVNYEGTVGAKWLATPSVSTQAWIGELHATLTQYAATLDKTDDAKRRLTGEARTVDLLETMVGTWASASGVSLGTYQVEARFGAYGALPVIVCAYGWGDGSGGPEHGFVLIDGINGQIDGPFVSGSTINPSTLLSVHFPEYSTGAGVGVVRADTGVCAPIAATRTPYPGPAIPPWTVPPGLTPNVPPPGSPRLPGYPQPWKCNTDARGFCVCTSTWTYVPTPGTPCPPGHTSPGVCDIKYEVVCKSNTPWGTGCNGGLNTTPAPAPPGTPPISVPGTGNPPLGPSNANCTESWWYWS